MITVKNKDKGQEKTSEKAPESAAVKRARSKLEKQLEKEHKIITTTAIQNMAKALETRLQRTSKERKPLKNKDIKLFDENKHSEAIHSQFVRHLQSRISRTVSS